MLYLSGRDGARPLTALDGAEGLGHLQVLRERLTDLTLHISVLLEQLAVEMSGSDKRLARAKMQNWQESRRDIPCSYAGCTLSLSHWISVPTSLVESRKSEYHSSTRRTPLVISPSRIRS